LIEFRFNATESDELPIPAFVDIVEMCTSIEEILPSSGVTYVLYLLIDAKLGQVQ
jgi:hypothetical protein